MEERKEKEVLVTVEMMATWRRGKRTRRKLTGRNKIFSESDMIMMMAMKVI